jgi:protein KTI12
LLSATIRSLASNRITICDSMNYIKGYRYQLYCAAKEAGCRTLTVSACTRFDRPNDDAE